MLPVETLDQSSGIADLLVKELWSTPKDDTTDEDDDFQLFDCVILNTGLSLWRTYLICERESSTRQFGVTKRRPNSSEHQKLEVPMSFIVPDGMEFDDILPGKSNNVKRNFKGRD